MHLLSYATLEQIVHAGVHGILLVEVNGHRARIRYANPAYERLSGYKQRELAGNAWSTHFAGDSALSDPDELNRLIMRGLPAVQKIVCLHKDGTAWESHVHLSRVGGAAGEVALILAQHVASEPPAVQAEPPAQVPSTRSALTPVPPAAVPSMGGMLSANQFRALLSRDLAIARRHQRLVTLLLFEIMEFEVYKQTFGSLAAEACARMIGTQILGTFGRSIDLRSRLDATTFGVAVHELDEEQSARLAAAVAEKTARLSLPNPRGCHGRHIVVHSACIEADADSHDADALIARARRLLAGEDPSPRQALHAAG